MRNPVGSFRAALTAAWLAAAVAVEAASPSVSVTKLPLGGSIVTADSAGNLYFTGSLNLTGVSGGSLPVSVNAAQPNPGGAGACEAELPLIGLQMVPCADTFVAKIQPATGAVLYATYLGGDTNDFATGIAVDAAGNAYVTGL